ncbi:hypothetical protein F220043C3_14240 [Enterocloster asparagiformis]|uniref:hypothetical protein n=1 Tax=Enterocloster asparagiformis TaxID=333367 RepID=UPI0034C2E3F1
MRLKKWVRIIGLTAVFSVSISFSSLAAWQQDANGWAYQNDDGTYPKEEWKQIDNSWYYFDQNGYRLTGEQKIGFNYYYFDDAGVMASSCKIQFSNFIGVYDKGGALLYQTDNVEFNHTLEPGYFSDSTFINPWADYKITFPDNFEVKYFNSKVVENASSVDFAFGTSDNHNYLFVYYVKMPDTNAQSPEELLTIYADGISAQTGASKTEVTDKTVGGYPYKYVSCYTDSGVYTDYYCRIVDNHYMFIQNLYTDVTTMDHLINQFSKVN